MNAAPTTPPRPTPGAGPSSRRDRLRQATTAEIKAAATALLQPQVAGDLSLRAVARQVGLTPSAIYRYFASRDAIVAALASDAGDDLAAALDAAGAASAAATAPVRALDLARAYRRWCLDNPTLFLLLATTDQESLARAATAAPPRSPRPVQDPDAAEVVGPRPLLHLLAEPSLEVLRAGTASGAFVLDGTHAVPADLLTEEVVAGFAARGIDVTPAEVGAIWLLWSTVHGYVVLELGGQARLSWTDVDAAYDHHLRLVLRALSP